MTFGYRRGGSLAAETRRAAPVLVIGVALAAATVARLGLTANAIAWAAVQLLFVGLAAHDLATRRIPDVVTAPAALAALALRVGFERSTVVEILIAGAAAFGAFLAVALLSRGGLGLGDVKLAGLLGLLLGYAVLPALLVGTVAGGLVGAALVVRSRSALRRTLAYGPYLCFGGAVGILLYHPPALV